MPDRSPRRLDQKLPTGLYEELITEQLSVTLKELQEGGLEPVQGMVEAERAPHALAEHIRNAAQQALAGVPLELQVNAANNILQAIAAAKMATETIDGPLLHEPPKSLDRLIPGPRELLALAEPEPGTKGVYKVRPVRPTTPLVEAGLLTNAKGDTSLGAELRAELTTADGVDLLCAFVKWTGLSVLHDQLTLAAERGVPIRVITTTYIGATERQALDWLVRRFGAQVKVNYEVSTTRLHAKAWLFRRRTGYDTAYVGSSNLSKAALLDGLEWNVRLSSIATKKALTKFEATFNAYWEDDAFEAYDPDRDAERLDAALQQAWGSHGGKGNIPPETEANLGQLTSNTGIRVRPLPHQLEMLEHLRVAREVYNTNLLVAATGTGKTVIAALDYLGLRRQLGQKQLKLLFIAHRQEILEHAQRTYQVVLREPNFGKILSGKQKPDVWDATFATIQSLTGKVENFDKDMFDIIVIDECHHAVSPTYKKVMNHFTPLQFLGLTATPERMDGKHVQDVLFQGRIAAEMRLWEALEDRLLCPFHYFGLHDGTDLRNVDITGGEYEVEALTDALLANGVQARHVIDEIYRRFATPQKMRAIGFCASVRHAEYMAEHFRSAGLEAMAVTSQTPDNERRDALTGLHSGDIQVLFTRDLFNEGIDIPDIDTLLMLRPTSSATIFLQQLGRGLRRSPNKTVLTVLDFIGHQHQKFRFEPRYRALTGYTHRELVSALEREFPQLPAGCEIILDAVSQERVLKNIRDQVDWNVQTLAADIKASQETTIAGYLHRSQRDIADLYDNRDRCWTNLLRRAKLHTDAPREREAELLSRIRAFLNVDDAERLVAYSRLLQENAPRYEDLNPKDQGYARMLFFSFFPNATGLSTYQQGLDLIRRNPAVVMELSQVLALDLSRSPFKPAPLPDPFSELSLALHASYTREEIWTALNYTKLGGRLPASFNAGVAHCKEINTDAFLITIEKDQKKFTQSTMYNDYASAPNIFHWETQSGVGATSATAQRYIHHVERGSHVLLFARRHKETERRLPQPWLLLGPARHISHEGSRPMKVVWKLEHAMPNAAFQEFRREASSSN
ncbi:DUF3427 domain-containing protein [Wenjunlia tyrosinilytica]|uniref:Helicase n=1 Tax=Wenjunlia tyrosinilytica TaxID=1544741 RepID=A0A918DW29_9ACTN|nr:DUF3427 domain-containing protein [Wenjunlia tyrosinilytica]GGO85252.1 helicase [Wenjunlia tyrosinilytica]